MQTLQELRAQIQSTRDLGSIAKAMKALSAVRIRQSRETVASLRRYADTVEQGLQIMLLGGAALPRPPVDRPSRKAVAVVVGSDLGMVGQFNTRIASFARERLPGRVDAWEIIALGERVASQLTSEGEEVTARLHMPDTVETMASRVRDLLIALEKIRARLAPDLVLVFFNAYRSGASYEPVVLQLLPLDPSWLRELSERDWPERVLPGFNADRDELMSSVVREHLFVSLMRSIAESHASENASRLAAMESAERRIEERLSDLTGRMNQSRQQKMTEELLDILTGAKALEEREKDRHDERSDER
ncbi:MAG: FoF1 ATP synthase subunit gamma [Gemmatimonadota bacterium]